MHKNTFSAILLVSFLMIQTLGFSQMNPLTNSFGNENILAPKGKKAEIFISGPEISAGFPCNPNTFWSMSGGSIDGYTLSGNTITSTGAAWTGPAVDANLAYCNNLDGGTYSPTFYSTFNYQQPLYFNGTSWITATTSVTPDKIYNPGGNGNFLYYLLYPATGGIAKGVVRYTGSSFVEVYGWDTGRKASVADLAVDSAGNVFVLTGPNTDLNLTDTLTLVSPSGQTIHQWPFPFDSYHAYGMFLLNGSLYIGLGSSNTVNPSSLVPVIFSDSNATAGTPMALAFTGADLASCDVTVSAVNDLNYNPGMTIYPNPVNSELIIQSTKQIDEVKIIDMTGRLIYRSAVGSQQFVVNVNRFENGIYYVQVYSQNTTIVKKIIIQH